MSQREVNAAKAEYLMVMRAESVISRELVEHGLLKCRQSGYVRPVSAGQFCSWAWESAMKQAGIPSYDQALSAVMERLKSPSRKLTGVYYHILTELDWHLVKESSKERIEREVSRALDKTIRCWKAGRAFREPRLAKPSDQLEITPLPRSEQQQRLRKLMGGL